MENNPFGPGSFESPSEDSEKPSKDKKKTIRVPFEAPKETDKPRKSPEERPKSEAKSEDTTPEKTSDTEPAAPETITSDETEHLVCQIATERLKAAEAANEQVAAEIAPATEFLQKLADGEAVDDAYREVATELGMTEEEITESLAEINAEAAEATELPQTEGVSADSIPELPTEPGETTFTEDEGEINLANTPQSEAETPAATAPVTPAPFWAGPPASERPTSAPTVSPETTDYYDRQQNKGGELLTIGLVGYLLGRRRGRSRAEKRLVPMQKQLETQVRSLQKTIVAKERQLVTLQAAKRAERPVPSSTEQPLVRTQERLQPGRQETRLGMQKPAERLGHLIVAAEAPRVVTKVERPSNIREAFRAEEVKAMPHEQVLQVAEKIKVEDSSLRQIYEAKLIGEKQLRHLVAEHLAGKDIRPTLKREMVERQIDFERDPQMRDRIHGEAGAKGDGTALQDALTQVDFSEGQAADVVAQHRAEQQALQQALKTEREHRNRIIADSVLGTAIVVLAVAIIILVLNR